MTEITPSLSSEKLIYDQIVEQLPLICSIASVPQSKSKYLLNYLLIETIPSSAQPSLTYPNLTQGLLENLDVTLVSEV